MENREGINAKQNKTEQLCTREGLALFYQKKERRNEGRETGREGREGKKENHALHSFSLYLNPLYIEKEKKTMSSSPSP